MLGCVIGGVGMAGMPYPPNLCASVPICGRLPLPEGSVCSAYSVGHSLHVCLFMSVVVFSHGIHGMLGCVIGGVGMAGCHTLLICAHLCLSVGGFLCQKVLCVPRVLWDTLSVCFVGASVGGTSPPVSVRRPIGFRPPPNQIAFATRSDSVRRPIRLRSLHDAISSVCTLRRLHCNTQCVYVLHPFMFAKLRNKFDF